MATVFTGKVAIPFDKIDKYLKLKQDAEKSREPFRKLLIQLNTDFHDHLLTKLNPEDKWQLIKV